MIENVKQQKKLSEDLASLVVSSVNKAHLSVDTNSYFQSFNKDICVIISGLEALLQNIIKLSNNEEKKRRVFDVNDGIPFFQKQLEIFYCKYIQSANLSLPSPSRPAAKPVVISKASQQIPQHASATGRRVLPQPVNHHSKPHPSPAFDPFATPEPTPVTAKQTICDPFATPDDGCSAKSKRGPFAASAASTSTTKAYDPFATPETSSEPFDPFAVPDVVSGVKPLPRVVRNTADSPAPTAKPKPALPAKSRDCGRPSAYNEDKKALPPLPPKHSGSASIPPALPSKTASASRYQPQAEKESAQAYEAQSECDSDSFQHRLELQAGHMAGDMVAKAATNEENQRRAGAAISNAANDEEHQRQMGEALAAQTDNKFLQSAAQNKTMQRTFGKALGAVATNRTVQKKAGQAIANQAQDEENQQALIQKAKSIW